MALLWNIQILSGFNMEPFHWWKTFAPLLLILSAVVVKEAYDRFFHTARVARVAVVILLALVIGSVTAKKALNAAAFASPPIETVRSYSVPRTVADSWRWMDANLPSGASVLTPSFVSATYMTAFTHVNPYFAHPLNTLAPHSDFGRTLCGGPQDFRRICG